MNGLREDETLGWATTVHCASYVSPAALSHQLHLLFPDTLREADAFARIANLSGLGGEARIEISDAGPYRKKFSDDLPFAAEGLRILVTHPKLEFCSCFLGIDTAGRRFIRKEIIQIQRSEMGRGLGTRIFTRQVEAGIANHFQYISMHAARGQGMNGYSTCP